MEKLGVSYQTMLNIQSQVSKKKIWHRYVIVDRDLCNSNVSKMSKVMYVIVTTVYVLKEGSLKWKTGRLMSIWKIGVSYQTMLNIQSQLASKKINRYRYVILDFINVSKMSKVMYIIITMVYVVKRWMLVIKNKSS